MPDRPTREYARMTDLEIAGRPVAITSAELCWIQHWRGEEPAQLEWEVAGRTREAGVRDGAREVTLIFPDRRLRGRGVITSSAGPGLTVFEIVGLGPLVEVAGQPPRS